MHWLVPVMLVSLVGYVVQPYFNKRIADLPSRTRNLCWQYLFAAIFANLTALVVGVNFFKDPRVIVIVILGIFNAFACYCYWRAIAISLSKTSLFTQADDLTAMVLGSFILGESRLLNFSLGIGIAFSIFAVFLFIVAKRRMASRDIQRNDAFCQYDLKNGIAVWVALYSIILGVAMFSMRYFALKGMLLPTFIVGWYSGAFIGALIVFVFAGKAEAGQPLRIKNALRILPLSLTIFTSLMLAYWARSIAPLIVTQPIFQVAEMILPTAMGLWVFKEMKELNLLSRIAIAVGLAGGIIIALSW